MDDPVRCQLPCAARPSHLVSCTLMLLPDAVIRTASLYLACMYACAGAARTIIVMGTVARALPARRDSLNMNLPFMKCAATVDAQKQHGPAKGGAQLE